MKNTYFQICCDILLTAYGLMHVFGQELSGAFIFCFLLAVTFAIGSSVPQKRSMSVVISLIFIAFIGFMPLTLPFLPLSLYEPYRRRAYPAAGAAAVVIALRFTTASMLVYLIIGCFFAMLLGIGTSELVTRTRSIIEISDTATEHRIDLERRNKILREQQDAEIYNATLRERNRIAREIHDNVGHTLSRCILMTGAIATVNTDESLKEPIAQLEGQLNQAMTKIRDSVHDLHDDSVDLKEGAELLIRDFKACDADLECTVSRSVPKEVKYCFLSVLREALTNVARHSNATQVHVRIIEHPAIYQLTIHDNGTNLRSEMRQDSFSSDGGRDRGAEGGQFGTAGRFASDGQFYGNRSSGGIGLENMRERVKALQGSISITADDGFRIFISIPKTAQE
ncbi:MAG: sensor histidine kinase [Eubacterium sp.]|jgi:signal transduction histidine kinase